MRMKKKRHGTQRINLLSGLTVENVERAVQKEEEIYGNQNPLYLEIGCGKGDFVRGLSEREPNHNFIALEKVLDVCVLAVEKYAVSKGLGNLGANGGWQKADKTVVPIEGKAIDFSLQEKGNVRFCVGDAKELLPSVPDDSLDGLYINFCDPWNKKGHAKRRLTYIDFLNLYSRVLKKGGKLCFKTDNIDLFMFSLEEFEKSKFEIVYKTFDLHASEYNETNIETEYERNFTEKGFKINMLVAENKK